MLAADPPRAGDIVRNPAYARTLERLVEAGAKAATGRRGRITAARVTRAGDWALGGLSAVGRRPDTGVLWAAANPRGAQGYAAGR